VKTRGFAPAMAATIESADQKKTETLMTNYVNRSADAPCSRQASRSRGGAVQPSPRIRIGDPDAGGFSAGAGGCDGAHAGARWALAGPTGVVDNRAARPASSQECGSQGGTRRLHHMLADSSLLIASTAARMSFDRSRALRRWQVFS